MTAQLAQSLLEQIEALQALLLKREQRINLLEEQVRLLKHQRFGKSSEQSERQAELFNEAEAGDTAEDDTEDDTTDAPTETITYQRTTRPRRKPLPADLPRVRIEHDLPEAEKVCACGCQLSPIGEATSERLDIIPATTAYWCTRAGNTPASAASRVSKPHRCRNNPFRRATPARVCWSRSPLPSTRTRCRCTARKRSSGASASICRETPWHSGCCAAAS